MNMNGLRNLITVLLCAGEGIHAFIPAIPMGLSSSLALISRAVMDQFWPASGLTTDWKNSLRNLLTVFLASGESLHMFFPIIPQGLGMTLALVIRAVVDQCWPAPAKPVTTP